MKEALRAFKAFDALEDATSLYADVVAKRRAFQRYRQTVGEAAFWSGSLPLPAWWRKEPQ